MRHIFLRAQWRRHLAIGLSVLVAGATAAVGVTTSASANTSATYYTGNGMTAAGPDTVKCGAETDLGQDADFVVPDSGGYLKWVLTATDATYAKLHGPWGVYDMIQAGGGAWHKATAYYPLSGLVPGKVWAEHDGTGNIVLTVSNGCPGLQGEIEVTKTAVPSFKREHKWKIDKVVTTENKYFVDGVPKIWLYTDGRGDEKATWKVKVDYDGYTDSAWKVSGEIKIKNTGDLSAKVTTVLDNMQTLDTSTTPTTVTQYNPAVTCPGGLPQDLAVGAELKCTYSQDLPSGLPGRNKAGAFGYFAGDMTNNFNESTGPVPFAFTAPTTEINKTVHVKDLSDLLGERDLGSVTAPNGHTFTYDKAFSWAGYGQAKCGSYAYDNTATIVETGQSDNARLKVNVQCFEFESAWAMGTGAGVTAKPFSAYGFSNWGWTNLIGQPYSGEWPLYAGAAQSDPSKGTLVGTFTVSYDAGLTYEFDLDPGFLLDGTGAVYAGTEPFPKLRNGAYTTAPGQYKILSPLSGPIHVIAHANVGIPDPDFGPSVN